MLKFKKCLALLLAVVLCLTVFAGCKSSGDDNGEGNGNGSSDTPLVIGYSEFSQKFSPFFASSAYDMDVSGMTQVSLMTIDRAANVIYNAIKGETVAYNGTDYTYSGIADLKVDQKTDTTVYTIKIRDDVKFSDGHVIDADDIIFSYYVLCDPSYDGSSTLYSAPIVGLKNYRANNSAVEDFTDEMIAAEIANPSDETKEFISGYIKDLLTSEFSWCGEKDVFDKYSETTGAKTVAELFEMFYGIDEDADYSGMTDEQVIDAVTKQYGTDYKTLAAAYAGDDGYFDDDINSAVNEILAKKVEGATEVNNISGIKKLDQQTVEVTTKGFAANAIYTICGIDVAPMHYYGNEADYDYDNNKFGFTRGDLSSVQSKTTAPMGAGPYKFVKYENRVVYFEANELYYKGAPKTKYIQFKESADSDLVPGVNTGTIDAANPSGSKKTLDAIASYNSNKETTGDKITTMMVDYLGYGYIGISANTVKVGDNGSSEESRNLRKAIATILSVYREVAIDTYYGDSASPIQYPISNTSWAAPRSSDEGYKIAFSTDVDGKDIYTSDMSSEDKYAAAIEAAKGFLKAAGYTYDEASGKFTAAPAGASMKYTVMLGADGKGDHPSFSLLTNAREALGKLGITLEIQDLTDTTQLWDSLDAGTCELWCAAWGAAIDPDMYQIYHSSNITGGTKQNYYAIDDKNLDQLIMDARQSADQTYRKSIYKQALDIIIDWAVEVPIYQRQDCLIFSSERVNIDTITKDITPYWGWMAEIEKIEMK